MDNQKMTYQERVERYQRTLFDMYAGVTMEWDEFYDGAVGAIEAQAEAIREAFEFLCGDRTDIDPDYFLLEHGYIESKTKDDEKQTHI